MQEMLTMIMVVIVLAFAGGVGDAASPGKQCRANSFVHELMGC